MITATLIGMPATQAALAALPLRAEAGGRVGTAEGAALIAERASSLAPVLSGALRGSVTSGPEQVSVGVRYAPFQEFGTRYMSPQPFMQPALAQTESEVSALVARAVSAAIGAGAVPIGL